MIKKEPETSLILPVTPAFIERRIFLVRGSKVMIDMDLAELYRVPTRILNQAVKRNMERFPEDFMFQLTIKEVEILNRSQIVIGSQKHRDPRFRPYAFTELGVAMLSSVLRSDRAVQMNIFIMRAFVKLRELLATHADLAKKIDELEKSQKGHTRDLVVITTVIKKLLDAQKPQKNVIGFQVQTD